MMQLYNPASDHTVDYGAAQRLKTIDNDHTHVYGAANARPHDTIIPPFINL